METNECLGTGKSGRSGLENRETEVLTRPEPDFGHFQSRIKKVLNQISRCGFFPRGHWNGTISLHAAYNITEWQGRSKSMVFWVIFIF